jgi:FAD:protein FMN transferase
MPATAPATATKAAAPVAVIQRRFVRAMSQDRHLGQSRSAVVAELRAIDEACSRFRPDSDLARVNNAAGSWTLVRPLLIEALAVALLAAEITDSLVDPTVGEAVQGAGYTDDFGRVAPRGLALKSEAGA